METSQSLSIESFSYSWLVNIKPSSLDSLENSSLRTSLDASDEASFIEMDPKMPPSKRFFRRSSQDFKFDFPTSPSPPLGRLVHADELISNGYLMPLFLDPLDNNYEYYEPSSSSDHPRSLNSSSPKKSTNNVVVSSGHNSDCATSLRRCRRLSKRLLRKYLNFLRPLYRRIRGPKNNNKQTSSNPSKSCGSHVEKRVQVSALGKSRRVFSSETASPRISMAYSAPDDDNDYCWRKSCDSDCSIYEAVLHCKRSIGN